MVQTVRKVVIAGGGTAGWIAAATLSSQLSRLLDITLIESDAIGTVGVGEATIPTQKAFHRLIGIDEQAFMRATRASFKLGIAFENWGQLGDRYIHSFGKIGRSTWMGDFQHMWHYAKSQGWAGDMDDYCFELQAAEAGKFATSPDSQISYAYHLDASLYAKFLRTFSEERGAKRLEGKIKQVHTHPDTGFIESLDLEDGQSVAGDLFIDCTGFRALLINGALGVDYEDWSHWLPMNSALAVQTKLSGDILPYTRSIARKAGWQWRIPLQHRVGNGHVYCSDHLSDDEAHAILMDNLDGELVSQPRPIRFLTGKRKEAWAKNCIALGLSSGFLEPLESTSIHLIQIGATRLVQMFPFNGVSEALRNHYNSYSTAELESIRDFLILHYKLNRRQDSAFWQERAALEVPDTLKHRMELYADAAIAYQDDSDLFRVDSWNQVMRGQGLDSHGYHPMGRLVANGQLQAALADLKAGIDRSVKNMPTHADFLRQYCAVEV
ncbi:tryptophan 7-halogenase [Exilibacterium tricleocarpae]|uniref:Tryptophan 7-halogenase n=1 Tax=Exilibacterium tricleocarpae TaxID=2591008 RepID=A0A545TLX0_9GAMM|nr:tryptophan halogenase family protein [Exilibacterium tricleocarpae]TQV78178.1 tryptophan 7-halogenase [Exilibacterium tricleocarpae]